MRGTVLFFLLLLSLGALAKDGKVSEAPGQVDEENKARPCLVFEDGRKVLLKEPPKERKGLVSFILLDGKGPYTARVSELDWEATQAGCPEPKPVEVLVPADQSPATRLEGKTIRNEDLAGEDYGQGTMSTMGSDRPEVKVFDDTKKKRNNNYTPYYPPEDDRGAWESRAAELRGQIADKREEVSRLEAEFSQMSGSSGVKSTKDNPELAQLNERRREADRELWRLEGDLARIIRKGRALGYNLEE